MSAYCENCGSELSSLFCESCGTISTNIPNSFSTDDSLAGLLANVIKQGKSLLFSQVLTLTKSLDRTYRIFAQLEKTRNYLIVKQENDYLIHTISSSSNQPSFIDSIKTEDKLTLIKSILELFPLTKDDLLDLFPLQVDFHQFVRYLGSNYALVKQHEKETIRKKA